MQYVEKMPQILVMLVAHPGNVSHHPKNISMQRLNMARPYRDKPKLVSHVPHLKNSMQRSLARNPAHKIFASI